MDLEDELPTPATSPVTIDHGAVGRGAQADVDINLVRVFKDVGTLPAMVTPLSDPEGGLIGSPAGYAVPAIADESDRMTQPLVVTSPAGLTDMDPAIPRPSTGSMGCSTVLSSPQGSLTSHPTGASPHVGGSGADGVRSGVPDLSREGPFDIHHDRPHSGASPRLLDDVQGC